MKPTRRIPIALTACLSFAQLAACSEDKPTPPGDGTTTGEAAAASSAAPVGSATAKPNASAPKRKVGKPTDGIDRFRTMKGKLGGLYGEQAKERLEKAGWKNVQASPKQDDRFEVKAKKGDASVVASWRYFQNNFEQASLFREARFKSKQLAAVEASYMLTVIVTAGGAFDPKASEAVLGILAP